MRGDDKPLGGAQPRRSGVSRMSPRMRLRAALAPHWGALLGLALFLIAGLAVLDDYGVTVDEGPQRMNARANLGYLTGGDDSPNLAAELDKFFGMGFEALPLLSEGVFRLDSGRDAYLARHMLTHLFFLIGGLFAYLLAHRLFNNKFLSLLAMLIFLLHPRLYAHSFFNSKDIPFFAMFMVVLYFTHKAFRKNSIAAFALLGVAAGTLTHLRIMGFIFLAAAPAMLMLDFIFAQTRTERKRVLIAALTFALTFALSLYALLPYLWSDPIRSVLQWWTTLSNHPLAPVELFRGTPQRSVDFPADYIPVWMLITSVPSLLLLGLIGAGIILARGINSQSGAFRNTRLRFGLFTLGCFIGPIIIVIALDANLFNGWRHMHFLWAPFSLLAAFGIDCLAKALRRPRLRKAMYGAAGAGVAATVISMALLHPNQQVAFNFFVDRVKPEYLRTQYLMDYWGHPTLQMIEGLLEQNSSAEVNAHSLSEERNLLARQNIAFLPRSDRERIRLSVGVDALVIADGSAHSHFINLSENNPPSNRLLLRVKAYNNTIAHIERKKDLRTIYAETSGQEPVIRSTFDVHLSEDSIVYVKEPCSALDPALSYATDFYLRFIPQDREDLVREDERRKGFQEVRFRFPGYGALFDGKCVASVPLPPYRVAAIRTNETSGREILWEGESRFDSEAYRDLYARVASEDPRVRSVFDIYVVDSALTYVKESCMPSDSRHPFFLHVIPERVSDLVEGERERGFANMDFELLLLHGEVFDGKCVASVPLPEYPIAGIRTGQRARDEWEGGRGALLSRGGEVWRAQFSLDVEPYQAAYQAVASSEPIARSVFDIHVIDGALTYIKEPCDQSDTKDRFFLHIVPEREDDLPEARHGLGFVSAGFDFFSMGAHFDGKCTARIALPDYAISHVRTGQFRSGEGELWEAEAWLKADGER